VSKVIRALAVQFTNVLFVALFFSYLFLWSLAKGGRWDLYQAIGMSDRSITNFGYSGGAIDQFQISTLYLPLLSIFLLLLKYVGIYQEEVLLLLGVLSVLVLIEESFRIFRLISSKLNRAEFFVCFIVISLICLRDWLAYAIEFKPDTIGLILFMHIVHKCNNKNWRLSYMKSLLLYTSALMAKQQIILPILFYLFVSLRLEPKGHPFFKRLLRHPATAGFGLLVLSSFLIPNTYFYALFGHLGKGWVDLDFLMSQLKQTSTLVFFLIVILILFTFGFTRISHQLKDLSAYIVFSFMFLSLSVLSAVSLGGNAGNLAVGFIPFMPVFIYLLTNSNLEKVLKLLQLPMIIGLSYLVFNGNLMDQYQLREQVKNSLRLEVQKAHPTNVLITDNSYLVVRGTGIELISSIDTWSQLHSGMHNSLVPKSIAELIGEINPDIIICIEGCKQIFGEREIRLSSLNFVTSANELTRDKLYFNEKFLKAKILTGN
jgi:hypothetical protein